MKIVICGSREIPKEKYDSCYTFVNALVGPFVTIISGGAKGGDQIGEQIAARNGTKLIVVKPNWEKFGKSAGFVRNKEMVAQADVVVAVWDGKSKGTKHTIDLAIAENKPVYIYKW